MAKRISQQGQIAAVLDSSAILALLLREPGGENVRGFVRRAVISTVNLVEVIDGFARRGGTRAEAQSRFEALGVRIAAFTADHATQTAEYLGRYRDKGLSLGDCACLALSLLLRRPVVTADREWAKLGLALDIRVIR